MWNYWWDGKKWTKPPFQMNGRKASTTDPATLTNFEAARAAYQRGGWDGIGIVPIPEMEIAGIDLDHCFDETTGELLPWAKEIVELINSYTERSPSGNGIRIFALGKKPSIERSKKGNIEIYDGRTAEGEPGGRFLTVTGQHLPGSPTTIERRDAEIAALYWRVFGTAAPEPKRAAAPTGQGIVGTDAEIVAIAMAAKNGVKFRHLWEGDPNGDESAGDLALCNCLAFYTGRDAERMDRIFRGSGRMRPKWDERRGAVTYGEMTIKKAIENCSETYSAARTNGKGRSGRHTNNGSTNGNQDKAPTETGRQSSVTTTSANDLHLTDIGNAERFAQRHGEDVRYCHAWNKWLAWDGKRWRIDDDGEVMRKAKDTILTLYRDAAATIERIGTAMKTATDEAVMLELEAKLRSAEAVLSWAHKSEDVRRLHALLTLARSEVPITPEKLDADPYALNVPNGTIDLRTGKLRKHRREDYLTLLCPTEFDPEAPCPRFLAALDTIFAGDDDTIMYVHQFLGYGLTGDVREDVLTILYGGGSNGKTVLVNIVQETVGPDYVGTVPPELLMETGDQHPTIVAQLAGKRLMVAAETGQGRRLNEARVKALTGRDRLKARRMREDFWEFAPTHKLVLVTNHKPEVRGTDHGIWRRLRLVPFNVRFLDPSAPENAGVDIPEHLRIDRSLPEALRAERQGILAWLVRGCIEWQRNGLPCPAAVSAATAEYRTGQDRIGSFVEERCITGPPDFRAKVSNLWAAYREWCEGNGERAGTATAFGLALAERGYVKDAGKRNYLGIAIGVEE
jgi:putative DNA primase/helicase